MTANSSSRRSAGRTLLSASPRMRRSGAMTTAAATTGPASGPRPASSTPAMRLRPVFQAFASYRYGAAGGTPGGSRRLLFARGGGGHGAGALFLEPRRLAGEVTQVIELRAAHPAAPHDVHALDPGRVQRERALDADAVGDAAHGERGPR